mmetsp:Transcript_29280/g.53973  ORF Transcript_29280/g.53973 Transcript_29280/m.53973 type:complete len:430 (-) Transcript_29280:174-1463(-)
MEQAMEGLSRKEREQLTLFCEVSANAREPDASVQLLKACNWDVEQALQLHLATGEDRGTSTASTAAAIPSTASSAANAGSILMTVPVDPIRRAGFIGRLGGRLRRFSAAVLDNICTFVLGNIPHLGAGPALSRTLSITYGPQLELPRFFEGSFNQAMQAARQQLKPLVVYLHGGSTRHFQGFWAQVLQNEIIRAMLNENFLLWGKNAASMDSQRVAQIVQARQYPCLSALVLASSDDIRLVGSLHGQVQVDEVLALLTSCLEEMETRRSEIVARREQQAEDRHLRMEQDREYQEALEVDRRRQELRQQEAAEAERFQAQRLELEERRKRAAASLQAPDPNTKSRISMTLPAGQRVERKFHASATLADVYAWADCSAYLPENARRGLEIPARFMLKTRIPANELTEMERSIEDLHLVGSMILLSEIEDSD